MLIHLDTSAIADAVSASDSSETSLLCIENALRAHHGCKHMISLRRDDLRALAPVMPRLSGPARAAIGIIAGKLSEIDGLRKTIGWHLELGLGPRFDGRVEARDGRHVIRADLHHFADFERASRSILLGENVTDARLYDAMGRAFAAHERWRVQLAFRMMGGGGSTLAAVLAEAAKDGAILLAIADSDRAHPAGGLGSTAKGLDAGGLFRFQRAIVLPVRSAENLISFEIYEEALAPHRETPSLPQRLMTLDRAVPRTVQDWRSHADLKSGLRLFRVMQMGTDTDEGAFWSDVSRRGRRDRCSRSKACDKEGDCACPVIEALGPRALEHVVTWMHAQTPKHLARLLNLACDAKLVEICAQIAAWGLAPAHRPN